MMPGENLIIPTENYPELQDLQPGDKVQLTIDAKVVENGEDGLSLETMGIETEVDGADKFQRDMSKQPNMMGYADDAEDVE